MHFGLKKFTRGLRCKNHVFAALLTTLMDFITATVCWNEGIYVHDSSLFLANTMFCCDVHGGCWLRN